MKIVWSNLGFESQWWAINILTIMAKMFMKTKMLISETELIKHNTGQSTYHMKGLVKLVQQSTLIITLEMINFLQFISHPLPFLPITPTPPHATCDKIAT